VNVGDPAVLQRIEVSINKCNSEKIEMTSLEVRSAIVPLKQSNACGGKGRG